MEVRENFEFGMAAFEFKDGEGFPSHSGKIQQTRNPPSETAKPLDLKSGRRVKFKNSREACYENRHKKANNT